MMPTSSKEWYDETPEFITEAEFHLDAAASAYRLHAVHRSVLDLAEPVFLKLTTADLVSP
jgi:hypothetical protein